MPRKKGITDESIIKMYTDGVSYKEMSDISGLSARAILNVITKNGFKATRTGPPRKHKVNEAFFDHWSNEMAWVLGLIVTDGNICPTNQSFSVSQKDPQLLEKIANLMEFTGKAAKRAHADLYTLTVCSKALKDDLCKLGVTKRKSLTVNFPNCPEEYLPSFVRGVIDGDGYVDNEGYTVTVTSGSYCFAQGLLSVYQKWTLRSKIREEKTKSLNSIYRVVVSGRESVKKLADIIYRDAGSNCVLEKNEKKLQIMNTDSLPISKRVKFRTTVSSGILAKLSEIAKQNNTYTNYLLESGMNILMDAKELNLKKNKRSDRVHYKSTFDGELLGRARVFAQTYGIHISDLIEYAAEFIDVTVAVREGRSHRIQS
ncbi:LAGLIDADG family homing endonuclease [Neobacillus sp. YIM B06451]|uniref:LAGLIDADG family homing endonuclease n=1 Tax=Neobacillus sp. YIM B06451 TaxID=3070994 RepID=UPI00292FC063|nr:LAGLIDADG family homing endonuclease [Neobacillus sp. YIM B06451]